MKIKYPINLKQILLFSSLIILVLGVSTILVSTLVRLDDKIKAEENNFTINERTAETIQSKFENMQSNSFVLFEAVSKLENQDEIKNLEQIFFNANQDILFIYSTDTGYRNNPGNENSFSLEDKAMSFLNSTHADSQKVKFFNTSSLLGIPSVIFLYEYGAANSLKTGAVCLSVQTLAELMSTGSNNATILVNENSEIIINPDYQSGEKEYPAVKKIISEVSSNPSENNAQTSIDGIFTAVHQIKNDLFVITT
ncbi:MAG: hypothetical protein II716_08020, partial [Treponema sp.]|nr:hypothetical protein [Treponema sp.]